MALPTPSIPTDFEKAKVGVFDRLSLRAPVWFVDRAPQRDFAFGVAANLVTSWPDETKVLAIVYGGARNQSDDPQTKQRQARGWNPEFFVLIFVAEKVHSDIDTVLDAAEGLVMQDVNGLRFDPVFNESVKTLEVMGSEPVGVQGRDQETSIYAGKDIRIRATVVE